jgi:EAL domain-containing protein (putative c-di-GMP-specific phosphodiesterase class I)
VVGFEALARGPGAGRWAEPRTLIRQAATIGRLPEFDWMCRAQAYRGALQAALAAESALFINVEPASLRAGRPAEFDAVIDEGARRFRTIAEVAEHELVDDPARLLAAVDALRRDGALIALDNVGAGRASRAMMSLVRPDVIKIDHSVIQHPESDNAVAVIDAVHTEAIRTGAVIVANGIETPAHLRTAIAMGATLGQGWLFGQPGPLPAAAQPASTVFPQLLEPAAIAPTPFEAVRGALRSSPIRRGPLVELSLDMEVRARTMAGPTVVLAAFQHVDRFDPATRDRYESLAGHSALAAVFARGMPAEPAKGLRGFDLAAADPMTGEWTVIVIGNRETEGLFARQRHGHSDRYDVYATADRDLVLGAARSLIDRMTR